MDAAAFTAQELHLLQRRLNGAVEGLAQELDYRRHPLTPPAARDQRFGDVELTRLYLCYRQLAVWSQLLGRPASPVDDRPLFQANGEMVAFLADELALTYAAAAYVGRQPFNRRLRRKLLRMLDIEARFFQLLLAEAGQPPFH